MGEGGGREGRQDLRLEREEQGEGGGGRGKTRS